MRVAIVKDGIVDNIVIVKSIDDIENAIRSETANIGDIFDGIQFTPSAPQPKTRQQLKAERDAAVASIVVTTSTGKAFNGDETSQMRMSRAIVGMQAANAATITWVLADNVATDVTLAELSEALVLAGQAQAAIWVLPE